MNKQDKEAFKNYSKFVGIDDFIYHQETWQAALEWERERSKILVEALRELYVGLPLSCTIDIEIVEKALKKYRGNNEK